MPQSSLVMSAAAVSAEPSEDKQLDEAISVLRDRATQFARMPAGAKAALLRECIAGLADVAPAWVESGCRAKGVGRNESGEEWLAGPVPTIRGARLLVESLSAIASKGRPSLGTADRVRRDGRLEIDVFPNSTIDKVMFGGFRGSVIMEEGVGRAQAVRRQASVHQQTDAQGGVSLILGAGNVSSIPPMDCFTKMFTQGYVCLLKMNPVNEWVGPHLERALAPLVSRGFLRIVYGGASAGKYLVEHAGIDDVHITGSDRTHEVIVWGSGDECAKRMAANDPVLNKPISSELGNVSPVAIVPYTYSQDELWFQARNVVSMVANNASFNCNAAKMLITSARWPQRDQFLGMVAKGLAQVPTRCAYYPGAFQRYETLTTDRERVQFFGHANKDKLAWAFIRDVDASKVDEPLFRVEPFCGVLSETSVGSADPVEFLDAVTTFMNERLWGTLNATLVIHPALEKDPTVARALERSIVALRYGTVGINHWPAVCYAVGSLPWGGHASADLKNIQSGLGWVHNTYMLEGIDKSVIRGPLRVRPNPVWFYDHRKVHEVGPRMARLEANPSWLRLPGLLAKAI